MHPDFLAIRLRLLINGARLCENHTASRQHRMFRSPHRRGCLRLGCRSSHPTPLQPQVCKDKPCRAVTAFVLSALPFARPPAALVPHLFAPPMAPDLCADRTRALVQGRSLNPTSHLNAASLFTLRLLRHAYPTGQENCRCSSHLLSVKIRSAASC